MLNAVRSCTRPFTIHYPRRPLPFIARGARQMTHVGQTTIDSQSPANWLSGKFLKNTREIFEYCREQEDRSVYSHDNKIPKGEKGPIYALNCYGFVNYVVSQTFWKAYYMLEKRMHEMSPAVPVSDDGRPCPFHYFKIFQSLPHPSCKNWTRIDILEDVRPGDVMVYLPPEFQPPIQRSANRRTKTHLMIVDQIQHAEKNQACVTIIDCTREPHSRTEDTRKSGGIGRATFLLDYKNPHSEIQWTGGGKKRTKNISIGRMIPSDE